MCEQEGASDVCAADSSDNQVTTLTNYLYIYIYTYIQIYVAMLSPAEDVSGIPRQVTVSLLATI